jgi:hypothetical protein
VELQEAGGTSQRGPVSKLVPRAPAWKMLMRRRWRWHAGRSAGRLGAPMSPWPALDKRGTRLLLVAPAPSGAVVAPRGVLCFGVADSRTLQRASRCIAGFEPCQEAAPHQWPECELTPSAPDPCPANRGGSDSERSFGPRDRASRVAWRRGRSETRSGCRLPREPDSCDAGASTRLTARSKAEGAGRWWGRTGGVCIPPGLRPRRGNNP